MNKQDGGATYVAEMDRQTLAAVAFEKRRLAHALHNFVRAGMQAAVVPYLVDYDEQVQSSRAELAKARKELADWEARKTRNGW